MNWLKQITDLIKASSFLLTQVIIFKLISKSVNKKGK